MLLTLAEQEQWVSKPASDHSVPLLPLQRQLITNHSKNFYDTLWDILLCLSSRKCLLLEDQMKCFLLSEISMDTSGNVSYLSSGLQQFFV